MKQYADRWQFGKYSCNEKRGNLLRRWSRQEKDFVIILFLEKKNSFVPLLLCDSPNPRNAAQALGPLSACHLGPVLDDIAVNHDALHDGRVLTRRKRGMTGLGPRPRQPDGINCLVPIVSHLSAQRCTPQTRG